MPALINFVLYQGGWTACVLSAAHGVPDIGVGVALAIVAIHLLAGRERSRELALITAAAVLGGIWDSLLVGLRVVRYPELSHAVAVPLWMIALWMLFATTLNSSLSWLQHDLRMASLLGAIGGPLAYAAADRLGALQLPNYALSMSMLCAGWAMMTPLLVWLARRGLTPRSSRDA